MVENSSSNNSTRPIPAIPMDLPDYEALPTHAPLYHQLIAGAFAGIMEHSVMFPIDALKTRIQSANAKSLSAKNMLSQISHISTSEGTLALWKGVQSVILGAGPAHAVYFGTYEFCKKILSIRVIRKRTILLRRLLVVPVPPRHLTH